MFSIDHVYMKIQNDHFFFNKNRDKNTKLNIVKILCKQSKKNTSEFTCRQYSSARHIRTFMKLITWMILLLKLKFESFVSLMSILKLLQSEVFIYILVHFL